DQHGGQPASHPGQGHDVAIHLLWRLLHDLARLRHGHAARALARAPARPPARRRKPAGTRRRREAGPITRPTPLALLAAGGSGGHLFPAEALAAALAKRGVAVEFATDARAVGYGGKFPARATHVIPSATPRGLLGYAKAGAVIALGIAKAYGLLGRLRPAAVVGFGGYPSIPAGVAPRPPPLPRPIPPRDRVLGRAKRPPAPPAPPRRTTLSRRP